MQKEEYKELIKISERIIKMLEETIKLFEEYKPSEHNDNVKANKGL